MKWDNYEPQQSYECLNACISGYMYNCGIKVAPEDIFFIGKGYNLTVTNEGMPIIGAKLYESNFRFLDFCNVKYVSGHFDENIDVKEVISKYISNGDMLSIMVSSELLTHNRVFVQTEGSPHYLNILAENENEYLIADGYVPTMDPTTFIGYVEKESIIAAFKKLGFRYFMGEYNLFAKDLAEIQNAADNSFKEYVKDFIALDARKKLLEQVFEYVDNLFATQADKEVIRGTVVSINYHLKIYGFITIKRYALNKIAKLLNNSELTVQYTDIVARWNKICMSLLKAGFSAKEEKFGQVKNSIRALLEDEKALFIQISDAL